MTKAVNMLKRNRYHHSHDVRHSGSEHYVKIKYNTILDTLSLLFFNMIKIRLFRGDVTEVSAKHASLVTLVCARMRDAWITATAV